MEPPSPARLYAAVVGALLFVAGIVGFFYDASFGELGDFETVLGVLPVNGWLNVLHVATGALGLRWRVPPPAATRSRSALLYTALAIVGWGIGFHLVVGVLGLAAAAGTPRPARAERLRGSKVKAGATKEPRNSKPRAQAAGDRL